VHTFRAWIVPRRDELLGIFACEGILVIPLFEGARDGCVPVFDVESTLEAVYLIHVGEIRVAALLLDTRGGWELWYASPVWNQVGHRWADPLPRMASAKGMRLQPPLHPSHL
jgi:hypothetical protein